MLHSYKTLKKSISLTVNLGIHIYNDFFSYFKSYYIYSFKFFKIFQFFAVKFFAPPPKLPYKKKYT